MNENNKISEVMYKEISAEKMIESLCEAYKDLKTFCSFLGAGASKNSNIASGDILAKRWFEEWLVLEPSKAKEFKVNANLTDNFGTYYSEIYDGRFGNNQELEAKEQLHKEIMKGIPSAGYYFLSKILTETKNNLTITTNFDYLVEDAINNFTQERAFSIADQSLTRHINKQLQYPIIAKLHGDTLARPLSASKDLEKLGTQWLESLSVLLRNYSSIVVVGHSGNDNIVEKFFQKDGVKDKNIYWCYWHKSQPSERLIKLMATFPNGYFVPIKGFDEIMFALSNKLFDTIKKSSFSYQSLDFNFSFENDVNNLIEKLKSKFNETLPKEDTVLPISDIPSFMKNMEKSLDFFSNHKESLTNHDEHIAKFEQALYNANELALELKIDEAIDCTNTALENFVPISGYDKLLFAGAVLGLSNYLINRGSIEDIKNAIFALERVNEQLDKAILSDEFEGDEFVHYKSLKVQILTFISYDYYLLHQKTTDEDYLYQVLRYFLKVYELHSDFRIVNCFLTYIYSQIEDWKKCIKHAKEWIELSKKPMTTLEESAMISMVMAVFSTFNTDGFISYFLALAYTEIGELEKAEKCLESLIIKNPYNDDELMDYVFSTHLYILKVLLDKVEDANKIFEKYLKNSKRDGGFFVAGINYLIHKKYDCAVSMFNSINKPDEWDKALLALAQYKTGKLDKNALQKTFDLLSVSEKANENFGKIILNKISLELDSAKNIDISVFKLDYKIAHQYASERYNQPLKSYYNILGKLESLLCDLWLVDYFLKMKNADKIGVLHYAEGILSSLGQQYPKLSIIKEKKRDLAERLSKNNK